MAKGFKCGAGGGAGGINFKVVAYGSADLLPASASENTIAVITADPISSWIFSATEPEDPTEGLVWFLLGTSSGVAFNALKKNVLKVYPLSASQYIGGEWVAVTAKTYQGGEWVDWWIPGTLFVNGTDDTDLTGGWSSKPYSAGSGYSEKTVEVELSSEGVCATLASTGNWSTFIGTNNKVDVTDYSTLKMEFSEATRSTAGGAIKVCLYSDDGYTTAASANVIGTDGLKNLVPEIDVSKLSGKFYIGYFMWTWSTCTLSAKMTLARLS